MAQPGKGAEELNKNQQRKIRKDAAGTAIGGHKKCREKQNQIVQEGANEERDTNRSCLAEKG